MPTDLGPLGQEGQTSADRTGRDLVAQVVIWERCAAPGDCPTATMHATVAGVRRHRLPGAEPLCAEVGGLIADLTEAVTAARTAPLPHPFAAALDVDGTAEAIVDVIRDVANDPGGAWFNGGHYRTKERVAAALRGVDPDDIPVEDRVPVLVPRAPDGTIGAPDVPGEFVHRSGEPIRFVTPDGREHPVAYVGAEG